MLDLADFFLASSQTCDDEEFRNACDYVSSVGRSLIPGQDPDFQRTSGCLTSDFLSSFLSLASKTASTVASDFHRRLERVSSRNTQLELHSRELENEVAQLKKNQGFEVGSSSASDQSELSKLRSENATLKNELDAATRKASHIEESNRQLHSTPILLLFNFFAC
jgi:hypothetical protein